ncbi:TenA family protein [Actinomyces sp. B33]|uniref:TenA family protein n=1 Tax=Actinomyces sp. B33 TaxID=2942131 RepID=UPI002341195A|nr:TenA family protein [Actinomyces sp. B33]MDC4232334.1 TenA family protein [Actinomyces sp. B33]
MTFSDDAWAAIAPIRAAIDAHPFIGALRDGTLDREVFDGYMTQDALYLADYGRALAGLATMSDDPDDFVFWAQCAANSILVERQLHASRVDIMADAEASPTCQAYTSFLLASQSGGDYPVAAAAVVPCFWIYQVVGDDLLAAAGDVGDHPYGDWIATYADPVFAEQTAAVRGIVDRLAAEGGPGVANRMLRAFVQASRYEWMFWDAAYRQETWPV